ncbi:CocE/NonD family hydrolase [Sphingobium sp. JS3065]|uniref:CocE/NonD family hydrolase n=1 Tax=Sphingobium sp. JS3065 TaxID=2970925 RepID=UPI0022651068|nr:CocE/NonD family hydrolase [Sphingobium sp. JS3065]UZW54355.1 CocE/NonD family hydrolase [Sphingobium sp. JS3065]
MKSIFEDNVKILMRDGVGLATNVWRPEGGERVPALLLRSPYGKEEVAHGLAPNVFALVRAGYAVVMQDVRGTFNSDAEFVPHVHDVDDGEDTIRWLAEQPWCDGSVGMWGGSYLGLVQWQAAATGTPALKAIVPVVTSADLYRAPWYSPGGALSLHSLITWSVAMAMNAAVRKLSQGEGEPADVQQLAAMLQNIDRIMWETPVADKPLVTKYIPWLNEMLAHPSRDEFWTSQSAVDKAQQIKTPALSISGWYDLFVTQQLADYVTMQERAGSEGARNGQRLIVGPWSHSQTVGCNGVFPDRDFGAAASAMAAQLTPAHLAFFDRWLKGREDALDGSSPVRLFVMGVDQWRDEQSWPLHDTKFVDYHLDGVGAANTANGNGLLTVDPATRDEADHYLYDPRRPVPSVGGNTLAFGFNGPVDQSAVEARDDVLCFSSAVLDRPLEVTGPISLKLFVSSSAVDTDFTAKLVDVFPDGRVIPLCEGILRMRYRKSLAEPVTMSPGEVFEITIDVGVTSNVFLPGHRLRLEVSSSNFPRYDRNSNTGGNISAEREADMVVAVNRIHRGPTCPSRLILPIIER